MAVDKQTNRRTQTQQHGKNDNNDDDWRLAILLPTALLLCVGYLLPAASSCCFSCLLLAILLPTALVLCVAYLLTAASRLLLLLLLLAILPPTALLLCIACPQCFLPLQMPVLSLDDRPWSPNLPPAAGVYLSLPFCLCLCFC